MRIGIDVFSLDKPGQNYGVGVGVYAWNVLPELIKQGQDHQFIIFANNDNKELIPAGENVRIIISPFSNRRRSLRVLHEQLWIPLQYLKNNLDCVHFLGINSSFLLLRHSIITVYDLMWKYYYDQGNRQPKFVYYQMIVPPTLRQATGIITISQFVANEIEEKFRRTANVYPVHLGPGHFSDYSPQEAAEFGPKYSYDYIYTVTTSMPHKNLRVLLEAFVKIRDTIAGLKLVITGQLKGQFHKDTEAFRSSHGLQDDIILTGFISDKEKTYCYRHASVFVFPSLYEGFGLPILEAMTLGVPVIAAKAASLPEVGGEACVYFNPNSSDELYERIVSMLGSIETREEMIERGKTQSGKFTWEKTANSTLRLYQQLFGLRDDVTNLDLN